MRLGTEKFDPKTTELRRNTEGRLKLDAYPRRQIVATILRGEMKAQDCILMVEVAHPKAVDIVETKRRQRRIAKNKVPAGINLTRDLPEMNLSSNHRKDMEVRVRLYVATPQIESDHFGVME
jgi:hypothetical protein